MKYVGCYKCLRQTEAYEYSQRSSLLSCKGFKKQHQSSKLLLQRLLQILVPLPYKLCHHLKNTRKRSTEDPTTLIDKVELT